jgi:phosphoglycerate dehydrogenase-like enzyme
MMLNVHLLDLPEPNALALFQARLDPNIRLTFGDEVSTETEILVGGRPSHEQLGASSKLRALIVPWAGVPEITRERLIEFPSIELHNLHHNAAPTAEVASALLLSAAKLIVPIDQQLRTNDWTPRYEPSRSVLLDSKTALILGYGEIGQRVARFCQALNMKILATRRNPQTAAPQDIAVEIHPPGDLLQLLPQANVLMITLPITAETRGLIGERELALLPAEAILVNIGRGGIVKEAALYRALRGRRLAAAGIDVWYNYPPDEASRRNTPPSQYPFHELDNVVMSPHRGGDSIETERLRLTHLADLLNAAAQGRSMPNCVDVNAGY